MIIAVDFDGTIVEHKYPAIGKEIPFAFETLRKLQTEHHKLILWSVREPRARRPHARQYRERPVRTGLRQQLGTAPPPRIPAALRRLLIQLPAAARHRRTVADTPLI